MATLAELQQRAYATACAKGWHDSPRNLGEAIALIHSELSEMLECARNGVDLKHVYFEGPDGPKAKPEGFGIECADVLIRLLDLCGELGLDLEQLTLQKMAYNDTRPHRHGKVF